MRPLRIAIVTDDPGWHGAQLTAAFEARGYETAYVTLTECTFDLRAPEPWVVMPGFPAGLPAGVFVRGVPGGTLDQVVLRLDILHALRDLGVPVCNDARAIERTVDKAMTTFLLRRAGIPTPDTWVCESESKAREVVEREAARGRRLVLKPLFGSQGEGLQLLSRPDDLPTAAAGAATYYLQEFIEPEVQEYRDWRVLVVGGRAEAGMIRRSLHWITNRARGARCERIDLDVKLRRLAEAAVRAIDLDYAGVDLLRNARGEYFVSEVNSVPAWMGLQSVTSLDIAGLLAEYLLARVSRVGSRGPLH